jgi:hypothetical protein
MLARFQLGQIQIAFWLPQAEREGRLLCTEKDSAIFP